MTVSTPITTPFTAESTAAEVVNGIDEELDRLRSQAGAGRAQLEDPEQGAATSVLLATSPLLDGIGGRYFEDCNEAGLNEPGSRAGSRPTPWMPATPRCCGRSRWTRWPQPTWPENAGPRT